MVNKLGTLVYDFPGTALDPGLFTVEGTPLVANNTAALKPGEGFSTLQHYDLTESSVYFKALFDTSDAVGVFTVQSADDLYLQAFKDGTTLTFRRVFHTNVTDVSLTYNSSTHAWWKIREAGGVASYYTSSDGNTWTLKRQVNHTMDLTSVTVSFSTMVSTAPEGYGYGSYGTTLYGEE